MLEDQIKQIALEAGAAAVGLAGPERLTGPPSMDPTYLLKGAKSIVSVMIPLDREIIRRYLAKEDRDGLQRHETEVYRRLYAVCRAVEALLRRQGHQALAALPNLDYRFKDGRAYKKTPYAIRQRFTDWMHRPTGAVGQAFKRALLRVVYDRDTDYYDWGLTPAFSHRYGAVASGLAAFGWSGNVVTPDHGAQALFCTVLTGASLASDPLMTESNCDECKLCVKSCQVGMLDAKEADSVEIGGATHRHVKKAHNLRCILCCAGFTGQSKDKRWSTWSPGRLDIPQEDGALEAYWDSMVKQNLWRHNYTSKNIGDLNFHTHYGFITKPEDRFRTTCGNCQFICAGSLEERKALYKTLTHSGVVEEGPGFSLRVIRPTAPQRRAD